MCSSSLLLFCCHYERFLPYNSQITLSTVWLQSPHGLNAYVNVCTINPDSDTECGLLNLSNAQYGHSR
jgi:hypothetical protein